MSGSKKQGSSSHTSPPPWLQQDYQSLIGQAQNTAQTPYQQYNGQIVEGFNPTQESAFGMINNAAGSNGLGIAQPYINQANQSFTNASAPMTQQSLQPYLSPYTNQVVDTTQQQFQNQNAIQNAGIVGNAASQGAWGGDRAGVAQGVAAGQEATAQAPVIAGLENQGYQTAVSTEEANRWLQSQAGFGQSALGGEAQNLAFSGANQVLGAGGLQQELGQEQLNVPYEQFQAQQAYPYQQQSWLSGIETGLGSLSGGNSESVGPKGGSKGSTLGGMGSLLGGAAKLMAANRGGRVQGVNEKVAEAYKRLMAEHAPHVEGDNIVHFTPKRAYGGGIARPSNDNTYPRRAYGGIAGYDDGGDVADAIGNSVDDETEVPTPRQNPERAGIVGDSSDHGMPDAAAISAYRSNPSGIGGDPFDSGTSPQSGIYRSEYTPHTYKGPTRTAEQERANAWMTAGLAMMAGRSGNAAVNIGEGGLAGLNSWNKAKEEDYTEAQKAEELTDTSAYHGADLDEKYADFNSRVNEATQTHKDNAQLHLDTLNMQRMEAGMPPLASPFGGDTSPQAAASQSGDIYSQFATRIGGLENTTGNRAQANMSGPNGTPTSSAVGNDQFTNSTWLHTVRASRPELAQIPDAQLLQLRKDPAFSTEMTTELARSNGSDLQKAGQPITMESLALAHRFGTQGALSVLNASPDAPMTKLLPASFIAANPELQNQTAGQYVQTLNKQLGPTQTADAGAVDYSRFGKFDKPQMVQVTGPDGKPQQMLAQQNARTGQWVSADENRTPLNSSGLRTLDSAAANSRFDKPQLVSFTDQKGQEHQALAQQDLNSGQWVTADQNRTPIAGSDMRIVPANVGGGGRFQGQLNRIITSANDAAYDLGNIVGLPITASTGIFGGRHQGPSLFAATKEDLANEVSTQDTQFMNTSMIGLGKALASLESGGMQTNQALLNQFEGYGLKVGDTQLTKAYKLAQMRQQAHSSIEANLSNPLLGPKQITLLKNIDQKIAKTIPWSVQDVQHVAYSDDPNATLQNVMKPKGGGAQPSPQDIVNELRRRGVVK